MIEAVFEEIDKRFLRDFIKIYSSYPDNITLIMNNFIF